MNIEELEADHELAQCRMAQLRWRVNLYVPSRSGATIRPIATAQNLEEIRTAQLAVIAAAIRCHRARDLSHGAIEAERTKIRAMDTEVYREYLLT